MTLATESISAARRASSLTLDEAAQACGIAARQTYATREQAPVEFRLGELIGLHDAMNQPGRQLLWDVLRSLFFDSDLR